ncbi:MAG: hypothetical protein AAGH90_11950 [Pseudomonadota bacterium]
MSFRSALFSAAVLVTPLGAAAQVESEGMSDITAWGARYLEASEGEFPARLWQRSSDETLLELMREAKTTRITPTERMLLRRVILSPTRRPRGNKADELLAERARLMLALGEAEAAAALVPRLETEARGIDAETLAVDLALARGDEATACRRVYSAAALPEGMYWLKLSAVCAVLREEFARAEFAVELATTQGLNDPWFINAIFAASGDVPDPPNARFDSGLNIALSAKADLDQSRITTSSSRPDLAAAAAVRPGVPPELAERFATLAGEAALLSPQQQRRILMARMQDEAYTPQNAVQSAMSGFRDPALNAGEKARRLDSALRAASRGDLSRLRTTVLVLLPELQQLSRTPETATYALTFAKASLVAGDTRLAQAWLATHGLADIETRDAFEVAKLEALGFLTDPEPSRAQQNSLQAALIEAAKSDVQRTQAARLLTLWQGFGLALGPDARSLISSYRDTGKRLDAGRVSAIEAAAQSGAIGETVLRILAETNRAPDKIAARDMAALIAALRQVGADDAAQSLAVEASSVFAG